MKVRYTVVNGEVLSENRGGIKRDYLPDTQGNTIGLIDSTQTITDTFSYYPYGEVASRTGTNATPFQFLGTLGYYRDSASRTYVRARTLNTAQGRWMTQDPIGFKGGDYNLYRYVNNRPTVLVDPSGMKCPPPNIHDDWGTWVDCASSQLKECKDDCAHAISFNICIVYILDYCCILTGWHVGDYHCGCKAVLRNIPWCRSFPGLHFQIAL